MTKAKASSGYDRFSLLWKCGECGRVMSTRQAQRAMEKGCLAGCSGIDVEPLEESKAVADQSAAREGRRG